MDTPQPLLVSAHQAARIIGISERTLHNFRKREDFPKPIVLGPRTVRWRRQEIEAWIASLPANTETRTEPERLCSSRHARKAVSPRFFV
jgi:predicted DNA-binding transcriptional regulator AlpA